MADWTSRVGALNTAALGGFGREVTYAPQPGEPLNVRAIVQAGRRSEDSAPGTCVLLFLRLADPRQPWMASRTVTRRAGSRTAVSSPVRAVYARSKRGPKAPDMVRHAEVFEHAGKAVRCRDRRVGRGLRPGAGTPAVRGSSPGACRCRKGKRGSGFRGARSFRGPRRSRRMTHLCSAGVTRAWNRTGIRNEGQAYHPRRRRVVKDMGDSDSIHAEGVRVAFSSSAPKARRRSEAARACRVWARRSMLWRRYRK